MFPPHLLALSTHVSETVEPSFFTSVAELPLSEGQPITAPDRVAEIQSLLKEIRKERDEKGSGDLPETILITDYHGAIDMFLLYLADSISRKISKRVVLDHKRFPDVSIEEQLREQDVELSETGLRFLLLGDLFDRGDYGMKCFYAAEELVNLGMADFVAGNHDLWAALNLWGFHLPIYEGFNFYGHVRSERLIQEHWNDSVFQGDETISSFDKRKIWWTEKLAEYNAAQDDFQKDTLRVPILGEGESGYELRAIADIRKELKADYLSVEDRLEKRHLAMWQDLIGYYFGGTDVYAGFNGIGKSSVDWWKERYEIIHNYLETQPDLDPELGAIWTKLEAYTLAALREVERRFDEAIARGDWWWQFFNDFNHQIYTSVEWWAKDWSSHKGWGTSVIQEINELDGEEDKWNQSNYILSPRLQRAATFYRANFNLLFRDVYGNTYTHGWLPVDEDDKKVRIRYKGEVYVDTQVWKGLERLQEDIKDLSKPFPEIHEALDVVNSWYADKTTRIKPKNIGEYLDDYGLATIMRYLGIRVWVTGHNPQNRIKKDTGHDPVVSDGQYHYVNADMGMSWQKFKDLGGYTTIDADGIHFWGLDDLDFEGEVVRDPRVLQLKKGDDGWFIDKATETKAINRDEFLILMELQLREELEQIGKSFGLTREQVISFSIFTLKAA